MGHAITTGDLIGGILVVLVAAVAIFALYDRRIGR